jgi:hypothetical protein
VARARGRGPGPGRRGASARPLREPHGPFADPDRRVMNGKSMLDRLRTPVFVVALILVALGFCVEVGARLFLPMPQVDAIALRKEARAQLEDADLSPDERTTMVADMVEQAKRGDKPPGLGVPALGLVDGLLLYTVLLMGLALLVPERIHGRLQGVVSLLVALLVLLASIAVILAAFAKLVLMLALLFATPFGTIAYFALFGAFNRGGAAVALSLAMTCKLAGAGALIVAHQRFLQNKGLVLLIVTALVATLVVSFLHGLVPIVLVSITDAIAAIVVGILAAVWAIVMLIGAIVAIVKAIV